MGSEKTDLVSRLNTFRTDWFRENHEGHALLVEAVREIERLQNRVAELQGLCKTQGAVLDIMERERKSHDRMPVVNRNQKLGL